MILNASPFERASSALLDEEKEALDDFYFLNNPMSEEMLKAIESYKETKVIAEDVRGIVQKKREEMQKNWNEAYESCMKCTIFVWVIALA